MTGEEVLRELAEERQRQIAMNSPEHQRSAMLTARPYLSGAFHALARANAFENPLSLDLLEELLAPIEQPLVDEGVIERVSAQIEATYSVTFIPSEDPDR